MDRIDKNFASDECGAVTAFGLFFLVTCFALLGVAVDYANAMRVRTNLQMAADSAAHAALVARQVVTEDEAIANGLAIARTVMPTAVNGTFIQEDDFQFGIFDRDTGVFTELSGSSSAVRVDTGRAAARGNSLSTLFLRIIGIDDFDVIRSSIYETYAPRCLIEGFVSDILVDVTSNNVYGSGYCLHSNGTVEIQNNNVFEEGAIVAMPSLANLVIPKAGMTSNLGLQEALRVAYYDLRVSQRIDYMFNNVSDPSSEAFPSYLTSSVPVYRTASNNFTAEEWVEGRINEISCSSSNKQFSIKNNEIIRNGVLVTNCKLSLGSGVALEDVIVLSSNDVTGAAGVRLGLDDDCAPGGDAQIITTGTVSFPSDLSLFGARIIAEQSVNFTAQSDAVQGASILSNGEIRGTANGQASICGAEGMPLDGWTKYFRLAA